MLLVARALRITFHDFQVMVGSNLFPIAVSQGWNSHNNWNTSGQIFFFFLNSSLRHYIGKALLLIYSAKMKAQGLPTASGYFIRALTLTVS